MSCWVQSSCKVPVFPFTCSYLSSEEKGYILFTNSCFPCWKCLCCLSSSSSSLPLSLQRIGQWDEGSEISAVYHKYYHSGRTSKFFTQYLFSNVCQKPYLRLIILRWLEIGLKIGLIPGEPFTWAHSLRGHGSKSKRLDFLLCHRRRKRG